MDRRIDRIEHRFAEIEQELAWIKQELKALWAALKSLEEKLSGSRPIDVARDSSVEVIYEDHLQNTTRGCGNLVEINGQMYVATAGHVTQAFGDSNRFPTLTLDPSGRNHPLKPIGRAIRSRDFDAALIPVQYEQNLSGVALTVSGSPVKLGTMLWGISPQLGRRVLQYCRVIEVSPKVLEADCGGTEGFSGTGYVNSDGFLVGIHEGDSYFPHSGEEGWHGNESYVPPRPDTFGGASVGVLNRQWNKTLDICLKVTELPMPRTCFDGMFSAMQLSNRNPSSTVGEAYHLLELVGAPPTSPPEPVD
jgi:hypothetical protein